ncbi:MAG: hypothetical protein ACTSR4_01665 [Candidatus Hodarchaeales archaeon]
MKDKDPFSELLINRLKSVSSTEQEAIAIALGFMPQINKKITDKFLKKCLKSQDIGVRRSAIVGIAFSSLRAPSKKPKSQQKKLKKFFKDPLSSIKLTAALGQGINAYFSSNKKYHRKINGEMKKGIRKKPEQVKQGLAVGMGLLGVQSKSPEKDFKFLMQSYKSFRMNSPTIFFIGYTLSAINANSGEVALDFFLSEIIPNLTSKESRRIAIICCAFLLPLISDPEIRMDKLQILIDGEFEFQSKFGTDLAITFTFFSLMNNQTLKKSFLSKLEGNTGKDPDYLQIFDILSNEKKTMDILLALIRSNTVDIKASGINASFFLESSEAPMNLDPFIREGLTQQDSGHFDRFLILLRSFSFCLLEEKYSYSSFFQPFMYSNDHQVKRIASLAFACLFRMDPENEDLTSVYNELKTTQDENIRWGLIVGLSMYQVIGKVPMDDELIIGLLLLCLGFSEAGISLVLSQAMIPKLFPQEDSS